MSLIDAGLHRSRTVLSMLVLVLLVGSYAFLVVPKESAPDIPIPVIYVSMHFQGISPEDSERLLIRPMEQELKSVEGIKEMRSTAYQSGGNVILEFEAGFDADKAKADVIQKVDIAKSDLPAEADEPTVNEVNFSLFPIISILLSGDVPERSLVRLARGLRDRLETIPTVLEVDIGGDREEQVEIIADPVLAESYGLISADVLGLVDRSNQLVAAGALDTGQGRFSIKVPGVYETMGDILDQPVKVSGDAVVTVGDVAEVRSTFKESEGFARVDGRPAVSLEVKKRTGENVIDTVAAVRALVAAEQPYWPPGIEVVFTQDQSKEISNMLFDLQNSVIAAILLVMVVVVAALGLRSGLLVGMAIPGSFLLAITVLYGMGLTVNIVVLFSLILAVGMLVDGAIVVTELADRKMQEGLHRREAYLIAAKRMAWPVIASTATTLAAFMPLLFWTGVVGEFMKYMPITLLATLSASLLMALLFVPVLGAKIGKPGNHDPETMKALAAGEKGDITAIKGLTGRYARLLSLALSHPLKVMGIALALLVSSQLLYGALGKGVEFFPYVEPEQAFVHVHARGNLSIEEKDALVQEVEQLVIGLDGVETVYGRSFLRAPDDQAEDIVGTVSLTYADWEVRPSSKEILETIRQRTAHLAGIRIEPAEPEAGPPTGKPVQVQISARNPDVIEPAINHVLGGLEQIGGFTDIEDGRPIPGIEWRLEVDRAQAAKFGGDISAVGDLVQLVTNGLKVTSYRPPEADDEVDIVLRYTEPYRSLNQLDRLSITTDDGQVPVDGFVSRVASPKVGDLTRVDGKRAMTIKANVADGLLPDTQVTALKAWLADNPAPGEVQIAFKGEDEEQKKSMEFLMVAFTAALFVMAVILVTQFNSFYSAFLILTAVIMSTIGVFLGLLIAGQPFGIIMSGVGVISLAGIVVNNNIVLIDTYDNLAKQIKDPREAILRTGVQRLRPVMLTTITTALGLLPMVFSLNIDFINRHVTVGAPSMMWWAQLAIAVVSGLIFSTVLTLVVTPSLLMLRVRARNWRNGRKARKAERQAMRQGMSAVEASQPAQPA
ncbi:MAG: efflux RND transporter permease subunit [Rhodospirillaceae bacterium]